MSGLDWLLLVVFLSILTTVTKPLGIYLYKVLNPEKSTPLDFLCKPLEKLTYRLCGIDSKKEQDWKQYLGALCAFSFVSLVVGCILLGCQQFLPLNPAQMKALTFDLNFNTSVSFMTNTDWQSYGGESTMSYFSQMVPLTLQNFVSPAVGLATAAAFSRGISRHSSKTLGNFWVDLIRSTYYIFLPLAFLLAIFLISQGVPENFHAYINATTLDSGTQVIAQGPMASQDAIKILGTNGGGFTNVNCTHPYENPTPLSNLIQMFGIALIPAAVTYYFGREVRNQKHGWCLYTTMAFLFILGAFVCTTFEKKGNPQFALNGIETSVGNMEGKEQRFGIFGSTMFATITTCTSNGGVNSAHDCYTPIGGLVPMLNMQLAEVIWGGVGSGLYGMLIFVILSIFTVGLIVGRTPEYLGKRIEAFDIKMAIFALVPVILVILGFTAWACVSKWGLSALGNSDAHGFSEMLYAYSSAVGNNGSAFAGLSANTPWWNYTLSFAMLFGRFFIIIPVLVLAGSFAGKKPIPIGSGSFPVTGFTFTTLLISVIILLGALSFLPALIMGPFFEQFLMNTLKLF